MKKLLLVAALLGSAPCVAQERTQTDFITPLGYCQFTAGAAALVGTSCSGGIPARTAWAVICIETANIRWRDDGSAPTTTVGMPVSAGGCLYYSGTFATFQTVAQSGSPVVNISFYSGAPRV